MQNTTEPKSAPQAGFARVNGREIEAAILDLDGVITRTAREHARAWKRMFDAYLRKRSEKSGEPFVPFTIEGDYVKYVDGKPRYEGVRSFLESRGIELEYGEPSDPPGKETYCGLGNRKNELFRAVIDEEGVEIFEDAVKTIKLWRSLGLKTAVVSSSKNCAVILRAAKLEHLFQVRVDGKEAEEKNIPGKPAPDLFVQAAEELGTTPAKSLIVEDAIAGVQAGRAGNFALVVGIARREGEVELLAENGADVVVRKLTELETEPANGSGLRPPSALDSFDEIAAKLKGKKPAVFLDYDGTLTPIVNDPEKAFMAEEMRDAVRKLADLTPVAVISGRDRQVVEDFVQIKDICYAGSHGFDIRGPNVRHEHPGGVEVLDDIEAAERELSERLAPVDGALVERKRFALAIHYRNVADSEVDVVADAVREVHAKHPKLRKRGGKMIFELQPDVEWDKGKALLWLLNFLDLDKPEVVPFYIGDDLTDEDAFAVLQTDGIGIVVGDETLPSKAHYWLRDPDEARAFLEKMAGYLQRST